MKPKPGAYFIMVVMAVSLAIVLGALTFPYKSIKILPMIIGSIVFVLAAIALVRELRSKKETRGPEEATSLHSYWSTGAWMVALALAIYLIGFLIAIPLFIIAYLKIQGRGWLKGIIIAGITTPLLYAVFELSLQVRLYRGLLFSLGG